MGLSAAFSSGDFNRMSDSPLAVSKVKHKAIVDVDRQGTVGAAATGTILRQTDTLHKTVCANNT